MPKRHRVTPDRRSSRDRAGPGTDRTAVRRQYDRHIPRRRTLKADLSLSMVIGRDRGDRQGKLRPLAGPALRPTMSPSKPDERTPPDRRQSFRCAVKGPRRHGRLRVGTREFPVRILDESVGGFAVESDEVFVCQAGDTLLLDIALNWVEVRVVNVASPQSDDSQDGAAGAPTRLNLMRIRDVDESEANPDDTPLLSWSRFRSMLTPLVPLGRTFRGTATMIVAVIATGIVLVWVLENSVPLAEAMRGARPGSSPPAPSGNHHPAAPSPPTRGSGKSKPTKAPLRVEAQPSETAEPDKPQAEEPSSSEPPAAGPATTARPSMAVPKKVLRLAHPNFLLKPEIVKLLSLRRAQRDELRRLFAEYQAASKRSGAGADELLQDLGDRVFEVLSDEQRRSLVEFSAAMSSSTEPGSPEKSPAELPTGGDEPAGR